MDTGLVCVGAPTPFPIPFTRPDTTQGISSNLYNNIWGVRNPFELGAGRFVQMPLASVAVFSDELHHALSFRAGVVGGGQFAVQIRVAVLNKALIVQRPCVL